MAGRRFSEVAARRWSSARADLARAESRLARRAFKRAIWERSISASMRSVGMVRGSSATKSFTPTTIRSFFSTARWNSYAGFVGEDLLGAEGDERGVFSGQGERFVHGIGVEGLAAAENGGEGLNRDADDVVFRLLCGERRAGGLRVEAQHQRARIFCAEAIHHDVRPEAAGGAVLGDFFEKVVM